MGTLLVRNTMTGSEISKRWPHISRYLRVDSSGWVEEGYLRWHFANERVSLPCVEVAAAYQEWVDFYQFRLEQRSDELAEDYRKRNLVERWTEDMTYCIRRCAAYARGEDPGKPVPMSVRRPDLEATHRAIVAEIIARHRPTQPQGYRDGTQPQSTRYPHRPPERNNRI